jgi:hypothetical protein
MNTRRHAHGVRGRAKPSMIISAKLQKTFKNLVNQILNMEHIPMDPHCFLYAVIHVLKVIEDV